MTSKQLPKNLNFGFFRLLGCVKASGRQNHKQVNIRKYGPAYDLCPRESFHASPKGEKTQSSGLYLNFWSFVPVCKPFPCPIYLHWKCLIKPGAGMGMGMG